MNVDTGKIITEDELKKLPPKEQARHIQITKKELESLETMNRHQRRAWAAKKRKMRGKFGSQKQATIKVEPVKQDAEVPE